MPHESMAIKDIGSFKFVNFFLEIWIPGAGAGSGAAAGAGVI